MDSRSIRVSYSRSCWGSLNMHVFELRDPKTDSLCLLKSQILISTNSILSLYYYSTCGKIPVSKKPTSLFAPHINTLGDYFRAYCIQQRVR